VEFTHDDMMKLYKDMVYIRRFELRMQELLAAGAMPGHVHLGLGQEACMAGVCFSVEDGDTIGSTHREHGVLLCMGLEGDQIVAEFYGKRTGLCKGKGGEMHSCRIGKGVLGNNAILGPAQTIITGFGYANKMRNNGRVAISMFGEGAANRGEFHEGMNLAALWRLPVIYILSDNGYALSTSQERQQPIKNLSVRAAGYGMPGVTVDGNDVLAVAHATREAVQRARAGEGPSMIELKTHRWRGHFEGEPAKYRDKEILDYWKSPDKEPIARFEKLLTDNGIAAQDDFDRILAETDARVEGHVRFAESSEYPPVSEVYTDIYDVFEEAGA
jgi:pyruvate dehydrogenase E1 component alpha subunit